MKRDSHNGKEGVFDKGVALRLFLDLSRIVEILWLHESVSSV